MKSKVLSAFLVALLLFSLFPSSALSFGGLTEEPLVDRISGKNRYETAVAISQEGWETSDYVVLARGDEFADALAGVPLAYSLDAPILLTRPNGLPDSTKQELLRLRAKIVVILGGEGAVSKAVENELKTAMQLTTERIAGTNRFDTAGLVARRMQTDGFYKGKVIVANGQDFPDALAASAYAARLGYPIILCANSRIPAASQSALTDLAPEASYVVGGTGVISDEVMAQLTKPERIFGKNRYATATELAAFFEPGNSRYYVATGTDFADAIAGGVLAAKNDAGLLLVHKTVPEVVKTYISEHNVQFATIFGGTGAVSEEIEQELATLLTSTDLYAAVAAAQAGIEALPDQVAGAADSTEAQGYIDSVQALIDAVTALDPDYDTSAWDAVITATQAVVDDMKASEFFDVKILVTDTENKPIEGAWVCIDVGEYWYCYQTDAFGYCVLNLNGGKHKLYVEAEGYYRSGIMTIDIPSTEINFILESVGQLYAVEFTVTNDNGDPIEDAWIWVDRGDYDDGWYTDSSGQLTLNLPAGDYDYGVSAAGFFEKYGTFSVFAASELSIVLESLGQLYEVTFTVTDENGDPIEDAWIRVDRGDYGTSGYTDILGSLTLNLPAGDYDYGVSAAGFFEKYGTFSVFAASELSIVLESLGQLYEVTFTVTDENGDPIEDAWIWVDRGDYWESRYTDSSGQLTLNLPAGDYNYGVRAEGFTQKYGTFSVPADSALSIALESLGQLYEVIFTVTDADGNPIKGAEISVDRDDYWESGYTNSSGNLTLNLPAGDYELYVLYVEAYGYGLYLGTISVPEDLENNIVLANEGNDDYSAVLPESKDYRSALLPVIPTYANQYYDFSHPCRRFSFNPTPWFNRNNLRYFQSAP